MVKVQDKPPEQAPFSPANTWSSFNDSSSSTASSRSATSNSPAGASSRKSTSTSSTSSRWQKLRRWLLHHKIETTAIFVCLAGAGVILALVYARPNDVSSPAPGPSVSEGGTSTVGGNGDGSTDTDSPPSPQPDVEQDDTATDTGDDQGDSSTTDPEQDDGELDDTPQEENPHDSDTPPNDDDDDDNWMKDSPMFQELQLVASSINLETDTASPQYHAAKWLVTADIFADVSSASPNLHQRFALATLYFSTGGTSEIITPNSDSSNAWRGCGAWASSTTTSNAEAATCVVKEGKAVCAPKNQVAVCDDAFVGDSSSYSGYDVVHRFLSPVHECTWAGITCDQNQVVTKIDIESNDLRGSLPPDLSLLTGLERLNLANNTIGGTIPQQVGLMDGALRQIFLQENALVGAIPDEIYGLTALERLHLPHNGLSGALSSSIGNLQALEVFYVNHNALTGKLPSELGLLASSLRIVTLHQNQFSGGIPEELGNLVYLESIKFANNDFTGNMPTALCGIPMSADCLYNEETGVTKVICDCCERCCDENNRCENW